MNCINETEARLEELGIPYVRGDGKLYIESASKEQIEGLCAFCQEGNDSVDALPEVLTCQEFLDSFPFFRASGSIEIKNDNPVFYITSIFYWGGEDSEFSLSMDERIQVRRRVLDEFIDASIIHIENCDYNIDYQVSY